MAKIQDLLKNYPQIINIIRKAGAEKIKIFKGFTPRGEHDLNILITQHQGNSQDRLTCEADITDDLTSLLECTVCVTDRESMLSEFYKQLNSSNSFELPLSDTPENRDQILKSLQYIFGTDWVFTKREPYDRETTEEEWQRYCAEMEEAKQWIEQHDREQDEEESSKNKGVGFFSQSTAATREPTTLEISITCRGVAINKTFLLDATPSPSELQQNLSDKLDSFISDFLQQQGLALNQQQGWGPDW